MPGQGGPDGDLGRFQVSDFPNHDHVGVLAEDMTQPGCKGQSDLRSNGNLVDPFDFVFHRVFDGDDAFGGMVDLLKTGIQGSGFSGTGWSGDQEDAVGFVDDLLDGGSFPFRVAELG